MFQPNLGATGFGSHSTREDFSSKFPADKETPADSELTSPEGTQTQENTPSTTGSTLDPLT
jgi:hypothetical protein